MRLVVATMLRFHGVDHAALKPDALGLVSKVAWSTCFGAAPFVTSNVVTSVRGWVPQLQQAEVWYVAR
jgi:hypothetical protein